MGSRLDLTRPLAQLTLVWVEDSEEFRAADKDHLTHVGRLPTCDVVPHPWAACVEKNHVRGIQYPHTHTYMPHTCRCVYV